MDSPDLARLQSISDRASGLRRTINKLKSAWPDGAEFRGSDDSGALTVTISAKGDVVQVDLATDWQKRIDERSLARAVNEAIGAASIPLADAWFENVAPDALDVAPRASSRPRVTLDEYRSRHPAPRSLDDLRAKFDLLAAARAEYTRSKSQLGELTARQSFDSPRGLFRVVRSRANLLALTYERNALTFTSQADIESDIVGSLDEIRRRSSNDKAEFDASFPTLAALRERDTERRPIS